MNGQMEGWMIYTSQKLQYDDIYTLSFQNKSTYFETTVNSKIYFYNQVHMRGKDEATFIGSHAFRRW